MPPTDARQANVRYAKAQLDKAAKDHSQKLDLKFKSVAAAQQQQQLTKQQRSALEHQLTKHSMLVKRSQVMEPPILPRPSR